MTAVTTIETFRAPSLDLGVEIASRELTRLMRQLESTLTPRQSKELHMIRLAAEALGAARASQTLQASRR